LYKIVDEVLKLLPVNEFLGLNWCNVPDLTPVNKLYETFQVTCLQALLNTQLPMRELEDSISLWNEWVERENFFPNIDSGEWLKKNDSPDSDNAPSKSLIVIDPGRAHRLEELEQDPRYTWNHVFLAGGWSPRGGGPHGSGVVIPKNWRGQSDGGGSGGYQV
jgi:hypothetical protein